jgi:hypothetical protein
VNPWAGGLRLATGKAVGKAICDTRSEATTIKVKLPKTHYFQAHKLFPSGFSERAKLLITRASWRSVATKGLAG